MHLFLCRVITIVFILLHGTELYSMTTTLSRVPARAARTPKTRSYIRSEAMHKINKPIKKNRLKKFNLAHGVALLESQTLPNLYEAAKLYKGGQQQEVPVLFQIIKKMFYRVMADGEITITKSV